eukprot:GHVS01067645.1.p1 GENE.GHVS01067645.1~~GHVS01067645.1.p1  ORF type:complete len:270 (-),score=39.76 GHVS01067645.1:216-1025(-)
MASPPPSHHKTSFQSIVGRAMSVFACNHHVSPGRSDSIASSNFSHNSQEGSGSHHYTEVVPDGSRSQTVIRQPPRRILFSRVFNSSFHHHTTSSGKKSAPLEKTTPLDADSITAPNGVMSESLSLATPPMPSGPVSTGPLLQCLSAAEKDAQMIIQRSRRQGELLLRKLSVEADKEVEVFREQHLKLVREIEQELMNEKGKQEQEWKNKIGEELAEVRKRTGPESAGRKAAIKSLTDNTLGIEFNIPRTTLRTLSAIGARQRARAATKA